MPQPDPLTYIITKVNNTIPKGIIIFTLKQDQFNPKTDYVDLTGDKIEMFSDYYSSTVAPTEESDTPIEPVETIVEIVSKTYKVGVGYKKHMVVSIKDVNGNDIEIDPDLLTWQLSVNDVDVTEDTTIISGLLSKDDSLDFTFIDKSYVGSILKITCTYGDSFDSKDFSIVN